MKQDVAIDEWLMKRSLEKELTTTHKDLDYYIRMLDEPSYTTRFGSSKLMVRLLIYRIYEIEKTMSEHGWALPCQSVADRYMTEDWFTEIQQNPLRRESAAL